MCVCVCFALTTVQIYSHMVIRILGSALQPVKLETKPNERHRRRPIVGFRYQLRGEKKCMFRIPLICIGKIEAKINMGEGGSRMEGINSACINNIYVNSGEAQSVLAYSMYLYTLGTR